ncbi:MAG TPA: serine/threonine-protein kinase [Polyangiaceae bacterium]|jgi:tetratricopeptide (TPR) repeat protein|nr:serine/threonine-protein kinase [Polyangiaceae bacterium]
MTAEAIADGRSASPQRIGARYDVHEVLGRGGMAVVYRATDTMDGRQVALKQLTLPPRPREAALAASLFEREFHTLAELSHPRIIEVYDYGIAPDGAYYTMELLDGGDLRDRSPVPWREACALSYEICSSLALIHSRRLVHRDISPRNVRCTTDGRAKLIDFGAMVPMGQRGAVVGTPAFVSPEVIHGTALDARSDLFSFGATLYFALTGRPAYPARDFTQLGEVWATKPVPPSELVAGVPPALDALVSSLLSLEPSLRPQTAFDVMHRLSAIAGLARAEPEGVTRAYLTAPVVVGRQRAFRILRAHMARALRGRGKSVLLLGAPGVGRSRMLDAFSLDAKTRGATVLRAGTKTSGSEPFALAQAIAEELVRAAPDTALEAASIEGVQETLFEAEPSHVGSVERARPRLVHFADAGKGSRTLQDALSSWLLRVGREHPVVLAVDDVERIDAPSGALLATLGSQVSGRRLMVVATGDATANRGPESLLGVLEHRSTTLTLDALTLGETEELLRSVFGDVPGVAAVSEGIHRISAGNPRACMDLAQHLVDTGKVRYDAGTWTLPERLDATDLPGTAEAAIRARIRNLSPLSRFLAEAQALSLTSSLERQKYALLCPDEPAGRVERAVTELLAQQIFTTDGRVCALAHEGWAAALRAPLSPAEKSERHRALVGMFEATPGLELVHHLLGAGARAAALDSLAELLTRAGDGFGLHELSPLSTVLMATILEDALGASVALERHPRETHELRRWVTSLAPASEDAFHTRCSPAWLEQLVRDSGLARWRELEDIADPAERRGLALGAAYRAYGEAPEATRVYPPDEAIKGLVQYVVFSIAVGSRAHDAVLIASLPELLEPFVALSPAVDAIWNNALATADYTSNARPEAARERWLKVHAHLEKFTEAELPYVGAIRRAIESGIGSAEALMGLATATEWAERLEQDNLQDINALYLRRAIRLEVGDWAGAERFRKQAELLALRAHTRQMFSNAYMLELTAHAMARDLTGLKQVLDRIAPLTACSPSWVAVHRLGEGQFHFICGDYERALEAFDQVLALTTPEPGGPPRALTAFPQAAAGRAETLIELGRVAEAKAEAERALAVCADSKITVLSHVIARALALAEAKSGDHAGGSRRLEELIREQTALGVTGLHLGASYEARARIAIWALDAPSIEHFGRLTAREYRHGQASPLAARYQRLLEESRAAVARGLPNLWELDPTRVEQQSSRNASITSIVSRTLEGAEPLGERASRALRLLCGDKASVEAHLYLCGDTGLSLAASQNTAAPPEGLRDHLNEYLARELRDDDDETAMVSELPDPFVTASAAFRDPKGRRYCPVCLVASVEGTTRYAGIAVMVAPEASAHQIDATIASAVAAHLIDVGDAAGITSVG